MSRRLQDVAGAQITRTPATDAIDAAVTRMSRHPGICTISGPIGTGKRTALHLAHQSTSHQVVWLSLPPAYSTRELIADLHTQIVGPAEDFTQRQLQDDLLEALQVRPRSVCIVNAERLTLEASGQLHWLQDRPGSPWTLYLMGAPNLTTILNRQSHLKESLDSTVKVKAIPSNEIPAILGRIHTLFATTDRDLLLEIDSRVCKGNLGRWIRFLHTCLEICHRENLPSAILDGSLARKAVLELPDTQRRGPK